MTSLSTLWLLVIMGSTGELKVVDTYPKQSECTAALARAPSDSGGMCLQAVAPSIKR